VKWLKNYDHTVFVVQSEYLCDFAYHVLISEKHLFNLCSSFTNHDGHFHYDCFYADVDCLLCVWQIHTRYSTRVNSCNAVCIFSQVSNTQQWQQVNDCYWPCLTTNYYYFQVFANCSKVNEVAWDASMLMQCPSLGSLRMDEERIRPLGDLPGWC